MRVVWPDCHSQSFLRATKPLLCLIEPSVLQPKQCNWAIKNQFMHAAHLLNLRIYNTDLEQVLSL
jgi:hypothetical protein